MKILRLLLIAVLSSVVFIGLPVSTGADGGPMVDPLLFARLKEGQQVAVVKINDLNTASVDLFVSILDQTEESHEITFFVPLGIQATGFSVQERDSYSFSQSVTGGLDAVLFQDLLEDQKYISSLFAGALLTNGIWLTPLWLPLLLSSCAAPPPTPESTFKTDSSEVNVYGLNETTDIDALVSSSGLDPKVTGTLSRLRGQRIAVVKLKTNVNGKDTSPPGAASPSGEPGLHLSWVTSLTRTESGATYAYPLGTGVAWAHPIEMTRVYIVVPAGIDFNVQYPKLGTDYSGYYRKYSSYVPRIAESPNLTGYAVDTSMEQNLSGYQAYRYPEYRGLGRVWRITYTNSNAAEDILVSVSPRTGIDLGIIVRNAGTSMALLIGLLIAALFWILAWYFLMPRLLTRGRQIKGLLRFSLSYIGWNALLFFPGAILLLIFSYGSQAIALSVAVVLFCGVSILIFWFSGLRKLGVSTGQAIKAFTIVTLVSNGVYLLFVLGYAALVGAI